MTDATEKQDAGKYELVRSATTPIRGPDGYMKLDQVCACLNTLEADRTALQRIRAEAYRGNSSAKLTLRTVQLMLDEALKDRRGAELQG